MTDKKYGTPIELSLLELLELVEEMESRFNV